MPVGNVPGRINLLAWNIPQENHCLIHSSDHYLHYFHKHHRVEHLRYQCLVVQVHFLQDFQCREMIPNISYLAINCCSCIQLSWDQPDGSKHQQLLLQEWWKPEQQPLTYFGEALQNQISKPSWFFIVVSRINKLQKTIDWNEKLVFIKLIPKHKKWHVLIQKPTL